MIEQNQKLHKKWKTFDGDFPEMVQWLRIRFAVQGMWVWSLFGKLRPYIPQKS